MHIHLILYLPVYVWVYVYVCRTRACGSNFVIVKHDAPTRIQTLPTGYPSPLIV